MSIFRSIVDYRKYLVVIFDVPLSCILEESLAFVLTDLKFRLAARVKQVKDDFIVDLHVLAFDFKLYFFNTFIPEHGLIIKGLFSC